MQQPGVYLERPDKTAACLGYGGRKFLTRRNKSKPKRANRTEINKSARLETKAGQNGNGMVRMV